MTARAVNYLVLLAYALFVAYLSLRPPGTGGGIPEPWDKVAHLAVYLCFALLAFRAEPAWRRFALLCIGIVAFSAAMEWGQSMVPGRFMSAQDFIANLAGVLAGVLLVRRWPVARLGS